jgi:hypothetical protein
MVFVVERYLPGLLRSDLLRGLSRLERTREDDGAVVRYLGSTIVLGDEACFCRFDGPTAAAVAEVNRKVGLPFDRIVPALTVTAERRGSMELSTRVHAERRRRTVVVAGFAALLAGAMTWAGLAFGVGSRHEATPAIRPAAVATLTPAQLGAIRAYRAFGAAGSLTPAEVRSIGSYLFGTAGPLTPAQLQAVRDYRAFGAAGSLTPAELQSIGSYLFGGAGSK